MGNSKRLDHIHGLRGVAAMMVVVQHAMEMAHLGGSAMFDMWLQHVNLGRLGIVLFFLISGVVIPFSFKGKQPLKSFVISRFFRLYPAYWLSIALFLVMAAWRDTPISSAMLIANLTMLQTLFGYAGIGNAYWTLALEMVFYGAAVVLFLSRTLRSPATIGIIAALFLTGSVLPSALGSMGDLVLAHYYFGMFFVGMMLRLALVDRVAAAKGWAISVACGGVLVGLVASGAFFPVPENGNPFFPTAALGAAMVLPIPLLALTLWCKPKPGGIMMYLGTISYSVYLFQQPVLDLLSQVVRPEDWPIGYACAVVVITSALASLVYRWVEQPMIDFGKKLSSRPARYEAKPALAR